MFKVEDILARLQNGEDAGDIAEEMAKVLNEANNKYQEEEEAKRAAAEAIKGKELQKLADLQAILNLIHDYCIEYYCDGNEDINTVEAVFKDWDAAAVDKMIEEAGAYAVKMAEVQKRFENMFNIGFEVPTETKKKEKKRTPDDVIAGFLNSMGL